MARAGISTIGVRLGYAVETKPGVRPETFRWLRRCNNIAGIALESESIDASALEDYVTRYIAGRLDDGGSWTVSFNLTDLVANDDIASLIADSETGRQNGLRTWFTVWSPYLTHAFFVIAEPPRIIPMPEQAQNELNVVEFPLVLNEYKGLGASTRPVPHALYPSQNLYPAINLYPLEV